MLEPLELYKSQAEVELKKLMYTDKMMYITASALHNWIKLDEYNQYDAQTQEYAVTNDGQLIGIIMFNIDWYANSASQFVIINFKEDNHSKSIFGLAVKRIFHMLKKEYHVARLEFRVVEGNPVQKHYDRWCTTYCGNRYVLHNCIRDRRGDYHNEIIYELQIKSYWDLDCHPSTF